MFNPSAFPSVRKTCALVWIACASAAITACHDAPTRVMDTTVADTVPREPYVSPKITVVTPLPDTSYGLGYTVRLTAASSSSSLTATSDLIVSVDAGRPNEVVAGIPGAQMGPTGYVATYDFPRFANGVHHLKVTVRNTGEVLLLRQFVTNVGERSYVVTALPPPGGATDDGDALAINTNGDAAGWSGTGLRRAVVWRAPQPQTLDDTATVATTADAIAPTGDVLVNAYDSSSSWPPCTRSSVWSATGAVRLVQGGACGTKGVRLLGDGSVLRAGAVGSALTYQERDGILVRPSGDTIPLAMVANDLNASGFAVGYSVWFYSGLALPEANYCNTAVVSGACKANSGLSGGVKLTGDLSRWYVHDPSEWVAVNDKNQAIGSAGGSRTLANPTGDYVDLTAAFAGGTLIAVNNDANVLGSLAGTPYLWRAGRTYAIKPTDSAWTIDRVHAMNDAGQIVGHGANSATGYRGAVLLTPMP